MSFVDLLRQSRSRPVSVFHRFLLSYAPDNGRTHAFVEGHPDLAFYRNFLEQYVPGNALRMYNCEGKANVYETYSKVVTRFPRCRYVLFFVDKDVDDILGLPWPADPRIHVTDCYAVEKYFVSPDIVRRFLADFVKIKNMEIATDAVVSEFERQLKVFHRLFLPVMAWIVATKRSGGRPNLNDINPGEFLVLSDSRIARRPSIRVLDYLERTTQTQHRRGQWRQFRQTFLELRRLEPKRYLRGKFEVWFLLAFIRRMQETMGTMARQYGGSISVSVQLTDLNFIPVLVRAVSTPRPLRSFLEFHFRQDGDVSARSKQPSAIRIQGWLRSLVSKLMN